MGAQSCSTWGSHPPEVPLGAVSPAPGFIWTCLRNWAVADPSCGYQACSTFAQVLGAAFLAGGGVTLGPICPPLAGHLAVSPAWRSCGKPELAFSCCECFQDWFVPSTAPLLCSVQLTWVMVCDLSASLLPFCSFYHSCSTCWLAVKAYIPGSAVKDICLSNR